MPCCVLHAPGCTPACDLHNSISVARRNFRVRVRQHHVTLHARGYGSLLEHWHYNKREVPSHRVSTGFLEKVETIHKSHALSARGWSCSCANRIRSVSYGDRYLILSRISNFASPHSATLLCQPKYAVIQSTSDLTTDSQHSLPGSGLSVAARLDLTSLTIKASLLDFSRQASADRTLSAVQNLLKSLARQVLSKLLHIKADD